MKLWEEMKNFSSKIIRHVNFGLDLIKLIKLNEIN